MKTSFFHFYRPRSDKNLNQLPTSRSTLRLFGTDIHFGPAPRLPADDDVTRQPRNAKLPPLFVNPALGTTTTADTKTYCLDGQAIFPPYARSTQASKGDAPVIGQGANNQVRARHNPAASVYVKRALRSYPVDAVQRTSAMLDEIALKLAQPEAATVRRHLAPEVLKEVTAQGRPVFYTRKITGFSLQEYFADWRAYRDVLPPQQLLRETEPLRDALKWLHEQGFTHNDVLPGNLMYDTENRCLVLIDFEKVGRSTSAYSRELDLDSITYRIELPAKTQGICDSRDLSPTDEATQRYVNPKLTTSKAGGTKTYRIDGQAVFPSYRQSTARGEPKVIASGRHQITSRRNPHASVHVKRSVEPSDVDKVRQRSVILNEIALKLAQPEAAGIRDHLAPEVLKEITAEGLPVYYTRKINGFSLKAYFAEGSPHRDALSPVELTKLTKPLARALEWLHAQGFAHGDVNPDNIVFDTESRRLVLIDFELVRRPDDEVPMRSDITHLAQRVTGRATQMALKQLRASRN